MIRALARRSGGGAASPRTARSHQELEFRALLDAAVDAIIVVDHHGTIEEFSRAAQQLFGMAERQVQQTQQKQVLHGEALVDGQYARA